MSINRSQLPMLGIECWTHVHKHLPSDCKTFYKCTENVMCLLFWTINREHMYILQSKMLFFLFLHVIFHRSTFFCWVKGVMIKVLRLHRGLHDTSSQMITEEKNFEICNGLWFSFYLHSILSSLTQGTHINVDSLTVVHQFRSFSLIMVYCAAFDCNNDSRVWN